jgi:ABC-2 type transport system permease protein
MNIFIALVRKEVFRFLTMPAQTIIGPVVTALLYQLIFGHQLNGLNTGIIGVDYEKFIIPGLIMMQVMINSFSNSSSSLVQAKYSNCILFILMAPISPLSIYCAYLIGSIVRGLLVGVAVTIAICWFGLGLPYSWTALIFFVACGCLLCGGLGVIAGIMSERFEHLASFQSFIIVPIIYLSGIFFNPLHLQGFWHIVANFDPLLYIVDGVRYSFIGHSSTNLVFGVFLNVLLIIIINTTGWLLVKYGVKIKN